MATLHCSEFKPTEFGWQACPQLQHVSNTTIPAFWKQNTCQTVSLKFRLADACNWILQCVQNIICSCIIWLRYKGLNSADGWMPSLGTFSPPVCENSWTCLIYECRAEERFLYWVTPPPNLQPQNPLCSVKNRHPIDWAKSQSSWFNPRTVFLLG